jgi:hypothetical protein
MMLPLVALAKEAMRRLALAIQARAEVILASWIFYLYADPKDSPCMKGWRTTLEPYLKTLRKIIV